MAELAPVDTSAVDTAILAHLFGDTELLQFMPDGVFWDVAPSGARSFVLLSLVSHEDTYQYRGSAFEVAIYLVKAVDQNTGTNRANGAAARIYALLQDVVLPIAGYDHMATEREERIAYTEVDPENHDTRWQHRGGRYVVWVSQT